MTELSERLKAQTEIRRRLLDNGYTPLANIDKRCVLPGWTRLAVTPELIDDWSTMTAYPGTGVRLSDGLAVADFDIDDQTAMDRIIDALPDDLWTVLEKAPVRHSGGPKEAWFFRAAEPFTRYASAGHVPPGADPAETATSMIEVFGGASARQFGAFGAHTFDQRERVVRREYGWRDDWSLLDVPLDQLPVLTCEQVIELCRTVNTVLDGLGWSSERPMATTPAPKAPLYDLHPGMTFETKDHGAVDLDELAELARWDGNLRLSASFKEPGKRNRTRCVASVGHDGSVSVYDHQDGITHKPASSEPGRVDEARRARLADLLSSANTSGTFGSALPSAGGEDGGSRGGVSDARAQAEEVALHLLQTYAFCAGEQRPVVPMAPHKTGAMTIANFKTLMLAKRTYEVGPRGGEIVHDPVAIWLEHPDRVNVVGYRFRPDDPAPLVTDPETGALAINLYRPPEHTAEPEGLDVWEAFLTHLLPEAQERAWFVNWLAAKAHRPEMPFAGVLMYTWQHGTGRGTLFDILQGVFGEQYVRPVSAATLTGSGGQGQYTDWLEDALIVSCDELMGEGDTGGNMRWARKKVYERLKMIVDPRRRSVEIVAKFRASYRAKISTSLLLATNHANALPVETTDRRFAILTNPVTPLRGVLRERVLALKERPGFWAAIWADLRARTPDFDAAIAVPHTLGRHAMIEANEGDAAYYLSHALAAFEGDIVEYRALMRRFEMATGSAGKMLGDVARVWREARDMLSDGGFDGWRRIPGKIRVGSAGPTAEASRLVVYARNDEARDRFLNASIAERGAMLGRPKE